MTQESTEATLSMLKDREEIKALVNRYAHAVWQGDAKTYASLFAEDGVIRETGLGISREIRGQANLEALAANVSGTRKLRPLVHNHVIDNIADGHATGYAYVEVFDIIQDFAKSSVGYYSDEYVKNAGVWVFQRRHLTFVWGSPQFLEWGRAHSVSPSAA